MCSENRNTDGAIAKGLFDKYVEASVAIFP